MHGTLEGMRAYQSFLLYGNLFHPGLSVWGLAALWGAMAAVAFALRSRPMKFGLGFLIVSMLPVCLITPPEGSMVYIPRNGYMIYIPLLGWALYTACLFGRLRDGLIRLTSLRPGAAAALGFAAFAAAAVLIMHVHAARLAAPPALYRQEQSEIRRVIERLRTIHPKLPRGSRLLVVDDPLPNGYALLFLAQLAYADPTLEVDRIKMLGRPPAGDELIRYDHVLAGGWELHDVRGISDARPPVAVQAGGHYTVEIPECSRQTVDIAIRAIAGKRSGRAIMRNCKLDSAGRAKLVAPAWHAPETIEVEWVRPSSGGWMSASGALDIGP